VSKAACSGVPEFCKTIFSATWDAATGAKNVSLDYMLIDTDHCLVQSTISVIAHKTKTRKRVVISPVVSIKSVWALHW
jgi:hypothetical protein